MSTVIKCNVCGVEIVDSPRYGAEIEFSPKRGLSCGREVHGCCREHFLIGVRESLDYRGK